MRKKEEDYKADTEKGVSISKKKGQESRETEALRAWCENQKGIFLSLYYSELQKHV